MWLLPGVQAVGYLSTVHMRSEGVWQDARVPFVQIPPRDHDPHHLHLDESAAARHALCPAGSSEPSSSALTRLRPATSAASAD